MEHRCRFLELGGPCALRLGHWRCCHRIGVGGFEDCNKLQGELGVSDNRGVQSRVSQMCFIRRTRGILLNTGFLDLQLGLCNPDI